MLKQQVGEIKWEIGDEIIKQIYNGEDKPIDKNNGVEIWFDIVVPYPNDPNGSVWVQDIHSKEESEALVRHLMNTEQDLLPTVPGKKSK